MSITVGEVIDLAIDRADQVGSNFVKPPIWLSWAYFSFSALYDMLVEAFEDYYIKPGSGTVSGSLDSFDVPSDFYKLRIIEKYDGTEWKPLDTFNANEKNSLKYAHWPRYRISGSKIYLAPISQAPGTYEIGYVPRPARFTALTDAITGVDGWEEYIVLDLAIKAMSKEESDVRLLVSERNAIEQRIKSLAKNRDVGKPQVMSDVSSTQNRYGY